MLTGQSKRASTAHLYVTPKANQKTSRTAVVRPSTGHRCRPASRSPERRKFDTLFLISFEPDDHRKTRGTNLKSKLLGRTKSSTSIKSVSNGKALELWSRTAPRPRVHRIRLERYLDGEKVLVRDIVR